MFSPCLLLVLEGFTFARAVLSFADVVFYRSVIDFGGDVVIEGIRLPADLRFVFDEILIALVDACGRFFSFYDFFFFFDFFFLGDSWFWRDFDAFIGYRFFTHRFGFFR